VVSFDRASRNRELFIQRVYTLTSLKRFSELKEMLLQEQSVIDLSMQHMFLAVVYAKLGETVAADNEWERALESADSLQKLLGLADYAEKNGALDTADAAYGRALGKEPALRPAYTARLRLAEALGDTVKAHTMAKEIVRLWPEDMATKVHEIYLRLLLDRSGAAAKTAEEEVTKIAAKNLWDSASRTTLALARLRQGRTAAALEAAPQPGPGVPASPALAVAWAANGWKDKAHEEVQKLATVKLLPEERALIAPLLSDQQVRK
jgi:tetratricopeptide (TPR) repeat protein